MTTGNREVTDHASERDHDRVADGTWRKRTDAAKVQISVSCQSSRPEFLEVEKRTHSGITEQQTQRSSVLQGVGGTEEETGSDNTSDGDHRQVT